MLRVYRRFCLSATLTPGTGVVCLNVPTPPPISAVLLAAIKAKSGDRGLNELARKAGVQASALSRFVNGERTLTLPTADKVAQALGLRLVDATKKKGNTNG